MSSDTHNSLMAFLASALSSGGDELATKVELEYTPRDGYRREMIRQWTRQKNPEYFLTEPTEGADPGTDGGPSNMAFMEELTSTMIELAENHADGLGGSGRQNFVVRVFQSLGTRLTHRFVVLPSLDSEDAAAERALVAPGGVDGGGKLEAPTAVGLTGQLMRHLEQKERSTEKLLDTFLKAVGHQANVLREENTDLRAQLAEKDRLHLEHLKEIEAARSLEHDRQIEAQRVVAAEERKTLAVRKVTAMLPVIVSRIASPPKKEGEASKPAAEQSTLGQLVQRFLISLSAEQRASLATALGMEQQVVLMEVGRVVMQDGDSPVLATMIGELMSTLSENQLTSILTPLDETQRGLFINIAQISQVSASAGQRPKLGQGQTAGESPAQT